MSYRKFINAKKFSIVVATDGKNGIGRNGTIPWDCVEDRKAFAKLTTGATLIVGRKTFESLPRLKNRKFIVLTTRIDVPVESTENDATFASSLNEAIELCRDSEDELFVAGGAGVYNEAILHPCCSAVYHTMIGDDYQCDRAFHGIGALSNHYATDDTDTQAWTYIMRKYTRVYAAEQQYLNVMTDIIDNGVLKENRTGIDTMAKFSQHFRYPLTNYAGDKVLPMLTSKRVSFKLVYSELLWLISGGTTTDFLLENNNHIWDANASREFLDKRGLTYYREGELGPVYGFQWRHFGADYVCANADNIDTSDSAESSCGIDQLQNVIDGIKKDPYGRRHIVTAWNPADIGAMALPACHHTFTFYVQRDELCCHLSMRSNDMFLGHPFNVASYALLTHMIASLCNLRATELTITSVDCHVYTNHTDAVAQSTDRELYGFPTVTIRNHDSIDDFDMSSIRINNYYSNGSIRADMAV